MSEPLTARLAAHLASLRFEDVPADAREAAQRSLRDAVGVSLAASGLEPACAPFAALAGECAGPAQVLGFGQRSSAPLAAFANGALAHALDFEDVYDRAPAHASAAAVPAALALAEADPGIDGAQLVTALSAASDLVCRLSLALDVNPDRYGFYTPAILSAFGAAAAAGKLLGLSAQGHVDAFALTLGQATSSSQFKACPDSSLRAVREAFAVQAGLTAARLAARGVRGFDAAFEGTHGLFAMYARGAYDAGRLLDGLGRRFLGARVSFKPWPSCRGTHAYIEAALALRSGLELAHVARIVAVGAPLNRMLAEPLAQKRAPRTAIDAKFSIPFCIGLALVRGAVTLDDFGASALGDPALLALAGCVDYRVDDALAPTQGRLEIVLRDQTRLTHAVEHPLGHPDNPLSEAQLAAKFVDCAGRARAPLSRARAEAMAEQLGTIERAPSVQRALAALASR